MAHFGFFPSSRDYAIFNDSTLDYTPDVSFPLMSLYRALPKASVCVREGRGRHGRREASGTPRVGFDCCPHALGRPSPGMLMHNVSCFQACWRSQIGCDEWLWGWGWGGGEVCLLQGCWFSGQEPQWGSQVETPSWSVGSFLGLVVRVGVLW